MKKIIVLITILILTGCLPVPPRVIDKEYAEDKVAIIEEAIPLFEEYGVEDFETTRFDGIIYKEGIFGDSGCEYSECQKFTKEAKEVFKEIEDALNGSEVTGLDYMIYENGKLKIGYFEFPSHNYFDIFRYIYEKDHARKAPTNPYCAGQYYTLPINDNWYFECEDWN